MSSRLLPQCVLDFKAKPTAFVYRAPPVHHARVLHNQGGHRSRERSPARTFTLFGSLVQSQLFGSFGLIATHFFIDAYDSKKLIVTIRPHR